MRGYGSLWKIHSAAYMEDGLPVKSPKLLFKHYQHRYSSLHQTKNKSIIRLSWSFVLDVLSVLPIYLILILYPNLSLLRLNRMFKFFRVMDFISMSEQK